jgi:ABC-2 type transport system ATP-binding protein
VDRVDGALHVFGPDAAEIGELAFRSSVLLHELAPHTGSLEEAFLQATAGSQEFRAGSGVEGWPEQPRTGAEPGPGGPAPGPPGVGQPVAAPGGSPPGSGRSLPPPSPEPGR